MQRFAVGAEEKTSFHSGLHLAVTMPLPEESEGPRCRVLLCYFMRASYIVFGIVLFIFLT